MIRRMARIWFPGSSLFSYASASACWISPSGARAISMAILAGMGAALDGGEEPLLAVFEQITDRGYVIGGEVDLRGDFGIAVTRILENADFTHQLERARVAASQVLDQAHHVAVLRRG